MFFLNIIWIGFRPSDLEKGMLQGMLVGLCLAELTQIEVRAYKALVSSALDRLSATLNARDAFMDEALFIVFLKRLFLLHYFYFFFDNSFNRFIAWSNVVHLFFFFGRDNIGRFFFNCRRLNLSNNLKNLNFSWR